MLQSYLTLLLLINLSPVSISIVFYWMCVDLHLYMDLPLSFMLHAPTIDLHCCITIIMQWLRL